jgi:molybdenum cofactor biosynthesis enzyme MoaA
MIGISKLYCGTVEPSDALRYGRHSGKLPSHLLQFAEDKKPVVVWNMTKACNLKCMHCYAHATAGPAADELSKAEAKAMIDDLAQFGAPVMLFSGGEPLMRPDLPELARYAVKKGMRAVISTNGTLISSDKAKELKDIGLSYVGVSLDGLPEVHDKFRGVPGAFDDAMAGIRNCMEAGLKVGLRFTVFANNAPEVPGIFDILEKEGIPRVCFYHLVYAGRGSKLMNEDLSTRAPAISLTSSWTAARRCLTRAKRPRCSRWTTTRTGRLCICACCARTRSGPRRCWSCSTGTRATHRAGASAA